MMSARTDNCSALGLGIDTIPHPAGPFGQLHIGHVTHAAYVHVN